MEEVVIYAGCDCGERYPVSIKDVNLETFFFACPKCGKVDKFTEAQIVGLKEHFGEDVSAPSVEAKDPPTLN